MGSKPRKKGKPNEAGDSIDTYFDCVSDCSLEDTTCQTECVDVLKSPPEQKGELAD